MDKIKKFFSNRITMTVEAILIIAGAIGLTIAGVSESAIDKLPAIGASIVAAIDGLLTLIAGLTPNKKIEKE